ncbi:MAG: phospholipase D-like domain-containing protein [Blastocatellia bacterium]
MTNKERQDGFQVQINHYSDRDFLELFRNDLAGSLSFIIILSPFLSENRAINYYPVLRSLVTRQVKIDVYTKPGNEQPESLREHYGEVINRLKNIGAQVFIRPGMHEKIGVIDGKILWHGSLNILSHNNTRESMLRFESPDLVYEVLTDLGFGSYFPRHETVSLTESGASRSTETFFTKTSDCPVCGQVMLLYEDTGMWICKDSPKCNGVLMSVMTASQDRNTETQIEGLTCPVCGSVMKIVRGIFQRIQCSAADCTFALDQRLSAGIMRALRKKNLL